MKNIVWKRPEEGQVKCNCYGASKGNPGESSYVFCVRNHRGDLLWVEASRVGITTNTKVEAIAILMCQQYCASANYNSVIVETDSINMICIVTKEWRIP